MTFVSQILVIEPKARLHESLAQSLERHSGILALQATTGEQAFGVIKDHSVAVILIDVDLSYIDGCQLCRLMRRQGVKTPIILLSAHDTDADLILGLDSGASDYIIKPFRFDILLARLRVQFRRYSRRASPSTRAPGDRKEQSGIPHTLGTPVEVRIPDRIRLEQIEDVQGCNLQLKAD